ncbi:MAG: nuclear transport factor 2 family protein [Caldilineaceae bacterium]|nr:nuclear transport factor 2 family protein [Caldilineaceae bacterium]
MELSQSDWDALQRLEEDLWRSETRFDRAYMESIFAADFREFGRSGRVYGRAAILALAPQPIRATLPLPDLHIRLLNPATAHVTYNSEIIHDDVFQHARRSSIWSRTPDGWQLRFHQGTPFEK